MSTLQKIREHSTIPSVSVLVPAFHAQAFICETLDSLNKQVFKEFQLLISIDKSDDDTELVIKRWCQEHKNIPSRIFCQTHRLGWIKNINFLLEKCQTKYFMLLNHADLLDETYIQKMLQCLKENPYACTAFSDIKFFGTTSQTKSTSVRKLKSRLLRLIFKNKHRPRLIISENSIKGKRFERTIEFLNYHLNAVAFRGLVNRDVISDFKSLPENDCSNFAIDTIWELQMALKGELIRVPEVLYHKRRHDHVGSVVNSWRQFSKEEKIKAWTQHCKDCLKIIFRAGFEPEEFVSLVKATKSRLVQEVIPLYADDELLDLIEKDRASLLENLEKTIFALGEEENYSSSQLSQRNYI